MEEAPPQLTPSQVFAGAGFDDSHVLVRGSNAEFKQFVHSSVHGTPIEADIPEQRPLRLRSDLSTVWVPKGVVKFLVKANGAAATRKLLDTDESIEALCEMAETQGSGVLFYFSLAGAHAFRRKVYAAIAELKRLQDDERAASVASVSDWRQALDNWHNLTKMQNNQGCCFLGFNVGPHWDALLKHVWTSAPHDLFEPKGRRELGPEPIVLPNAAFDEWTTLIRIRGEHFEAWTKSITKRLECYTFKGRHFDSDTQEWVNDPVKQTLLVNHAVFAELYDTPEGATQALNQLSLDKWLWRLVKRAIESSDGPGGADKWVYFSVRGAINFRAMVDKAVNALAHLQHKEKKESATEEEWLEALKEWQWCTTSAASTPWRFAKDCEINRVPFWNEQAWAAPI